MREGDTGRICDVHEQIRKNWLHIQLHSSFPLSHDKPSFCSTCDSHATEPFDKYRLSRNDILLHSLLKAQTHDSISCYGCWECVTWNSCSKYLSEGMFMHDEFVGHGAMSRVNYFVYIKHRPIHSLCTHIQKQLKKKHTRAHANYQQPQK